MKKVIHTLGSYEKAMKNIYDIVKPEYDKKGYISDKEILNLILIIIIILITLLLTLVII